MSDSRLDKLEAANLFWTTMAGAICTHLMADEQFMIRARLAVEQTHATLLAESRNEAVLQHFEELSRTVGIG